MPATKPRDIDEAEIRSWMRPRPRESHKGTFGSVGIIGGSPGMTGAALLAARAALWLGAGRVYVGMLDDRIAVDPLAPEIMITSPERISRLDMPGCLVIGPGLGTTDAGRLWLLAARTCKLPLLIDADGINVLAIDHDMQAALKACSHPALLTPHPGEAARLLGISAQEIQSDRPKAVQEIAERYRCVTVLKGPGTLIYNPGGTIWHNPTGNPGMAAAGMGDVLTGMIAALVAQGLEAEQAAMMGVYLHGTAADRLVEARTGPVGLTATEVARSARDLLNEWLSPTPARNRSGR